MAHATYDIMLEAGGDQVTRNIRIMNKRKQGLVVKRIILMKYVEGGLGCGVNMGKSFEWKLSTATHTPVLLENTTPTRGKLNNHSNG